MVAVDLLFGSEMPGGSAREEVEWRTQVSTDLERALEQEREKNAELMVELETGVSTCEVALDAGSRRSNQLEKALEDSRGTILDLEQQLSLAKSSDVGSVGETEALRAKLSKPS